MKYRIKNTKTTIKIIAIYQIIGGIFGIALTCWMLLKTNTLNGPLLFIFLLALFLYGFSIQSGNLLLQSAKLKKGLIFSTLLQSIQILALGFEKFTYEFYSGGYGRIGFQFGNGFNFDLGAALSSFNFKILPNNPEYFIKINILAIIIIMTLISIFDELKNKEKEIVAKSGDKIDEINI